MSLCFSWVQNLFLFLTKSRKRVRKLAQSSVLYAIHMEISYTIYQLYMSFHTRFQVNAVKLRRLYDIIIININIYIFSQISRIFKKLYNLQLKFRFIAPISTVSQILQIRLSNLNITHTHTYTHTCKQLSLPPVGWLFLFVYGQYVLDFSLCFVVEITRYTKNKSKHYKNN